MATKALLEKVELLSQYVLPADAGVAERRASYDDLSHLFPGDERVRVSAVPLDGIESYRFDPPDADDALAIFYIHGGGYAMGSVASHVMIVSYLAMQTGCRAYFPLYRLAPEHRFPAAIDDVVTAWRGLLATGLAAEQIAVAGDSAGGGLVFALMIRLKEEGLALPGCAYALSPWSDMEGDEGWHSGDPNRDPFLSVAELEFFAETYVDRKDYRHPWVAPMYGDLSALPPVLIQASRTELLYEDACRLADAIRSSGGEVILEVEPDAPHVWHHLVPDVPEACESLITGAKFIRHHLG